MIPDTRCEFICTITYDVAGCYKKKVKVLPQYEISGSHGKGPANWTIKIGDIIVAITEAKKENIEQGVGQNAIQLQTSQQHNIKKCNYNLSR